MDLEKTPPPGKTPSATTFRCTNVLSESKTSKAQSGRLMKLNTRKEDLKNCLGKSKFFCKNSKSPFQSCSPSTRRLRFVPDFFFKPDDASHGNFRIKQLPFRGRSPLPEPSAPRVILAFSSLISISI